MKHLGKPYMPLFRAPSETWRPKPPIRKGSFGEIRDPESDLVDLTIVSTSYAWILDHHTPYRAPVYSKDMQ